MPWLLALALPLVAGLQHSGGAALRRSTRPLRSAVLLLDDGMLTPSEFRDATRLAALSDAPVAEVLPVPTQSPSAPLADASSALSNLPNSLDRMELAGQNVIIGLREGFDLTVRSVLDPQLPTLPPLFDGNDILLMRQEVNALLLDVRIAGIGVLLASVVVAVVAGVIRGDRSEPVDNACVQEDEEVLLSWMPPARAALYDQGIDDPDLLEECVIDPVPIFKRISAGLWLELVVCVALDVVGDASYFFPTFGEASDLAFAFVYSFAVELLFDWPAMALFAFWEEALPITDLVPTATIAWLLVVTGVRTTLRDRAAEADRASESGIMDVPLADRRSFMPPEPHLQPENTLWDVGDRDPGQPADGMPTERWLLLRGRERSK